MNLTDREKKIAARLVLTGMDERRRVNYLVADDVVEALSKVRGIESVGVSDGFNDETTFTVSVDLEVTRRDAQRKHSGYTAPAEFAIPLRSVGSIVKRALNSIKVNAEVDGRGAVVQPVLDTKVFVPRMKAWRDDYGETHKVYTNNLVTFDVYMQWSWKGTASRRTAQDRTFNVDVRMETSDIQTFTVNARDARQAEKEALREAKSTRWSPGRPQFFVENTDEVT